MGLKEFFRALFGMEDPDEIARARQAAREQLKRPVGGSSKTAASRKLVCLVTLSHEARLHFGNTLQPAVEAKGYRYDDEPNLERAVNAQIVVLDVRPEVDAKLHTKYDKILRLKKSMGKVDDITCAYGPREIYKKYPRGTYPKMFYFCTNDDGLEHREPDLPATGEETIEGPTLYSIADMTFAITTKIDEFAGKAIDV